MHVHVYVCIHIETRDQFSRTIFNCVCVGLFMSACSARGCQKRESDSLELELEAVSRHPRLVLGSKLGLS